MTGQTISHYKILEKLGGGGMGVVYRAIDTRLARPVAIKMLAPEALGNPGRKRRFIQEARAASALNHPNIITIYEIDTVGGADFIAMEYVQGKTLYELIGAKGLPVRETLKYAVQIADALAAAHAAGIIHRDLKPPNVMITGAESAHPGLVKVLDFGIAKLTDPVETDTAGPTETLDIGLVRRLARTEEGKVIGTAAYMSPEQAEGKKVDARSDIFSFGSVLYEMLSGHPAFQGTSDLSILSSILRDEPAPAGERSVEMPPELDALIFRCLRKDPERRFQSAADLKVVLQEISDQKLVESWTGPGSAEWRARITTPASGVSSVRPRRRLPRPAWAGILGAAALVLVGVIFRMLPARREQPPPIPAQKNLVVLPFEAIGDAPEDRVYCLGFTETVTSKLGRVPSLQVSPAAEVRDRKVTNAEQARTELGANLVVGASWQRDGARVRINVNLVNARTGQQLASDTVTAPGADLFALQDQVVESAVRMLRLELGPEQARELTAHGTAQPAAYDDYLRGRAYLQEYHQVENIERAVAAFRHALELDRNYALAYAGLGEAYWLRYRQARDPRVVGEALAACRQAVSLDPRRAGGHTCLGQVFNETGKYEQAIEQFQKAVQLEPGDAAYRGLALAYQRLGKLEEAESTYRQAISIRPQYWAGYSWLGAFYLAQARYREAAEMFAKVVELAPDRFAGYYNLAGAYVLQGRYAEAIAMVQPSVAIRPTASAYNQLGTAYFYSRRFAEAARAYEQALKFDERNYLCWGNLGDAYYWAPGRRPDAKSAYQKAISLGEERLRVNPRDPGVLATLACRHAMLEQAPPAFSYIAKAVTLAPGDPEVLFKAALVHNRLGKAAPALNYLEKALAARYSPSMVRDDPIFDNLRDDPRFEKLLRERESTK